MTACNTVHIDMIGPYTVKFKHNQSGGTIKEFCLHLTCMNFINPSTGWFEIAEVPYYDFKEVQIGNTNYINKISSEIFQFLIAYECLTTQDLLE